MRQKEERFSIHTRAWGAVAIFFGIAIPTMLLSVSLWCGLFYLMLLPVIWIVWKNEKLPGGVEK